MDNAPASTFVPATVAASPSPSSSRPIRVPVVATRDPSNGDAGPLRIMMNHAPPEDAEARRAVYETLVQDAGLEVDRGYNVIILEPRLFSTVVTKYEEPPRREEPPPTVQPSRKRIYEAHESSALRMTVCVQNDLYVVPPLLPSRRGGVCVLDLTYNQLADLYQQCADALRIMHEPKVRRLVVALEEKDK